MARKHSTHKNQQPQSKLVVDRETLNRLRLEFEHLAAEGLGADPGNRHYRWLRAYAGEETDGKKGSRKRTGARHLMYWLSDGPDEHYRERFKLAAIQLGRALGSGPDPDAALNTCLGFFFHNAREHKSKLLRMATPDGGGLITCICEAAATSCLRLEQQFCETPKRTSMHRRPRNSKQKQLVKKAQEVIARASVDSYATELRLQLSLLRNRWSKLHLKLLDALRRDLKTLYRDRGRLWQKCVDNGLGEPTIEQILSGEVVSPQPPPAPTPAVAQEPPPAPSVPSLVKELAPAPPAEQALDKGATEPESVIEAAHPGESSQEPTAGQIDQPAANEVATEPKSVIETVQRPVAAVEKASDQAPPTSSQIPNLAVPCMEPQPAQAVEEQIFSASDDYLNITYDGKSFTQTKKQRIIIRILHEAHKRGQPAVHKEILLQAIDSTTEVRSYFRHSPLWGTLVIGGPRKGTFQLNLPRPPATKSRPSR